MEFLKILEYPNPKLRTKARALNADEIAGNILLIKNLVYTMYKADGIGLAATQTGIDKRIIVLDISRKSDNNKLFSLNEQDILTANKDLIIAINPEIVFKEGMISYEEGCLSIPKFNADVERASKIKVKAQDISGKEFVVEAKDLLSVAFQHEIDHLDGILFIDKVSPLKRSLYNASMQKKKTIKHQKELDYTS